MATATITIEDLPHLDAKKPPPFAMEVNYGIEGIQEASRAHFIVQTLQQAVLADAARNGESVGLTPNTRVRKPSGIILPKGGE